MPQPPQAWGAGIYDTEARAPLQSFRNGLQSTAVLQTLFKLTCIVRTYPRPIKYNRVLIANSRLCAYTLICTKVR